MILNNANTCETSKEGVFKAAMMILAIVIFMPPTFASAAEAACSDHLFFIERSKNKNIVAYDAKRGPSGEWDSSEPVITYWLLNGDKDKREELTSIERDRAYGVDVTPGDSPGTYTLVFKAQRKRKFDVRTLSGCPVVTASIHGRS